MRLLHFAPSTRTISAEGCARQIQNAISPAFRAPNAHDLRRGLRRTGPKRNLTCVSRPRHARPLHFAPSTRAISAEGCPRQIQNAISPGFRARQDTALKQTFMQKITSLETLVSSGRMKRPSHTTKTSRVQGIGLFRKCLAIARCLFHDHSGLIYWWTPDATFMDLNPTKLVFPPYNAYEWNERQVYTTAGEETPLSKLISHDLEFLAPDIVKLLGSGTFDINAVNSMMAEQKGSGLSRKKVACNWLKANEERWRPWIPVETACSLGFGLYDETKDRFATLRAGATTCRACLPGTYSMKIVDSVGVTYVCEACPPGQQQRGAGAVVCEPCPLGTSKGYQSIENCAPCQAGKYQDQEGTLMCKDCPNSTTTVLLGVTMLSDCVCKEGTMDVNDAGQSTFAVSKECVECTEGIRCPDGATLKGLQVGQNVTGFSGPAILEGYFSWSKEPLSIYKCPEPFCPGGRPGTCQGGRLGPTCSECAAGMYWANDQCTVCEVPLKVSWPGSNSVVCVSMLNWTN